MREQDESRPLLGQQADRGIASAGVVPTDAWVIIDLAPDAVLVVDERGTIDLANRAAMAMFGYDRESFAGLNVDALVPDGRREGHRHHRAAFAASPQTRPMGVGMDLWGRRADGTEFPVDISLSPVTFGQGPRYVAIVREVTVQRASQEASRRQSVLAEGERIGAYLRDHVIQQLFAAGLAIQSELGRMPREVARRLQDVIDELDDTIHEVRDAVFGTPDGRTSEPPDPGGQARH